MNNDMEILKLKLNTKFHRTELNTIYSNKNNLNIEEISLKKDINKLIQNSNLHEKEIEAILNYDGDVLIHIYTNWLEQKLIKQNNQINLKDCVKESIIALAQNYVRKISQENVEREIER